jgi:GNAT superfamily N-acetyltransferase
MHDGVTIRPGEPSDRKLLVELWLELIEHHRKLAPEISDASTGWLRRETDRALGSPDCRILMAEARGEGIGFLFAELERGRSVGGHGRPSGWIHEAYVRPGWRGRSVGGALVREGVSWLRDRGAARVLVRVEEANPQAHDFWLRHGFGDRARVLERRL